MAKIKKRKLHWKASESPQVVGYKLYWAEGDTIDYDSPAATLGNVTEALLPDDLPGFAPSLGPVTFGITATDELGNESDMVTISAAYQFNVPQAPEGLSMEVLDEFHATAAEEKETVASPIRLVDTTSHSISGQELRTQIDDSSVQEDDAFADEQAAPYYGRSERD